MSRPEVLTKQAVLHTGTSRATQRREAQSPASRNMDNERGGFASKLHCSRAREQIPDAATVRQRRTSSAAHPKRPWGRATGPQEQQVAQPGPCSRPATGPNNDSTRPILGPGGPGERKSWARRSARGPRGRFHRLARPSGRKGDINHLCDMYMSRPPPEAVSRLGEGEPGSTVPRGGQEGPSLRRCGHHQSCRFGARRTGPESPVRSKPVAASAPPHQPKQAHQHQPSVHGAGVLQVMLSNRGEDGAKPKGSRHTHHHERNHEAVHAGEQGRRLWTDR